MFDHYNQKNIGQDIFDLVKELFPICRSLTGDGVRETLSILQRELPGLSIHEVPSGTQCFDWTVPPEWNIYDAYIIDPSGAKIVDFKKCNLHVVGYSTPVDAVMDLAELQEHLYSLDDNPEAIPYITSYYKENWGFCLTHSQRQKLKPGKYKVVIDSSLGAGHMTYAELILPGESEEEVFLSTYICHPSMANNELSGPVVTTFLSKWLSGLPNRRYTYRIIFIPETIGSIYYLSKNLDHMKQHVIAGFNVSCVGDDRDYSYLPSRNGNTLSDRVARHILDNKVGKYTSYTFLNRGSDERQYCAPGVDLPIASVMRTRFGSYPEYHTSLDDLTVVTPDGLAGGFEILQECIKCLEMNRKPKAAVLCEPQMGRRGLYPDLPVNERVALVRNMMNLLAYSDGKADLLEISEIIEVPVWELYETMTSLNEAELISFE